MNLYEKASAAADFLRERIPTIPQIAVVLGSGLGGFATQLENSVAIPFAEVPYFPKPTAPGHSGRILCGSCGKTPVAVMQGRVHAYEGYSPEEVSFPVRVLGRLGVKTLILTNAAGGIRMDLQQGQLVLISDHINFPQLNPVAGPNDERLGPRFFDMTEAYSGRLRKLAQAAAQHEGFMLEEGVYLNVLGPSFETPAEIRAFRGMGADLVGMSTVMETIAARHMDIEVLGISCVTNMAAGIQAEPLNHEEVLATGRQVEEQLGRLLTRIVQALQEQQG
ncbi:purine-nucleoside phosphorylase [Acidipila rosea]|uniref:Purine nucleoside phosphorylase n=1 Tax=Acidipila rosea TaxID=768535 RepID=A0A4R1KZ21_9BACT|nr:purine-nucleoside phosphorylase [Acidipila rosea]TCK70786.1 purine-nucleoside phosphorylase [Acidipila rosea]